MTGIIGDILDLPRTSLPSAPALPAPSRWLLDAVTAAAHWGAARPWIGIVAAAAVAAGCVAHTVVADRRHRRLSRGARLIGLVLAHQNLAQLPRDTQLAVSANARNKVFFSCAPEDAAQLARHTLPELDEHDLSHLDAYTAACRLVVNNRETAAFTLRTHPARPVVGEAAAVRRAAVGTTTPPGRAVAADRRTAADPAPGGKSTTGDHETASPGIPRTDEAVPPPMLHARW